MAIPAVITAGDRSAAKAIRGESKVYLDVAGRPLVAHVLEALERVPEVGEVWVVGDRERLRAALAPLEPHLRKPLHLIEQFETLYDNAWQSYRQLLPGAGPDGRDPEGADRDVQVLYLSGDLPFATPQEISAFVQRGQAIDCDYAVGLVTEESMRGFRPAAGDPGVELATFNLREGRFRQSNLHLVRPGRLGSRHYIEDMYERRHQREIGPILGMAWRLLRHEKGGLRLLGLYALMHLAGLADRWGWRGLADGLRRFVPLARTERACSDLLRTRFRFVVTEAGGCAIDVDTEEQLDASRARYQEWRAKQEARAAELYGTPALGPGARQQGRQ